MIRIFISSTFRDMQLERDVLHERVLPALREIAYHYGSSVELCDLRWGIDTSDLESSEREQKALQVCLSEIDRCTPYMIVLLGSRYGTIFSNETISSVLPLLNGYIPDGDQSVTEMEIEYGALRKGALMANTLFYFRNIEGPVSEQYAVEDNEHLEKLTALKGRIRQYEGSRVQEYTVHERNGVLTDMDVFGDMVTKDLELLIRRDLEATACNTTFAREQKIHWNYAGNQAARFGAWTSLVEQYAALLTQADAAEPMALRGAAGSGKSTLVSVLAMHMKALGWEVLPVFCGLTQNCSSAVSLMLHIRAFFQTLLHERPDHPAADIAKDEQSRIKQLTEELTTLGETYRQQGDRRCVILIDGLELLGGSELVERLDFVAPVLNDRIRLVVTCSDEFPLQRMAQIKQIGLPTEAEMRMMITAQLVYHRKELSHNAVEALANKAVGTVPLYMTMLIQRLLMMNQLDFQQIYQLQGDNAFERHQISLIQQSDSTISGLLMQNIAMATERLQDDAVQTAIRWLAISRYGLRETDLTALLALDQLQWSPLKFSRFRWYMGNFFLERDDQYLDFANRSLRQNMLDQIEDLQVWHRRLLKYMASLPPEDEFRRRHFVYHCVLARDAEAFKAHLTQYHGDHKAMQQADECLRASLTPDALQWLVEMLRSAEPIRPDMSVWDADDPDTRELMHLLRETYYVDADMDVLLSLITNHLLSPVHPVLDAQWQWEGSFAEALISYAERCCAADDCDSNTLGMMKCLDYAQERLDPQAERDRKLQLAEKALEISKILTFNRRAFTFQYYGQRLIDAGNLYAAMEDAASFQKSIDCYYDALRVQREIERINRKTHRGIIFGKPEKVHRHWHMHKVYKTTIVPFDMLKRSKIYEKLSEALKKPGTRTLDALARLYKRKHLQIIRKVMAGRKGKYRQFFVEENNTSDILVSVVNLASQAASLSLEESRRKRKKAVKDIMQILDMLDSLPEKSLCAMYFSVSFVYECASIVFHEHGKREHAPQYLRDGLAMIEKSLSYYSFLNETDESLTVNISLMHSLMHKAEILCALGQRQQRSETLRLLCQLLKETTAVCSAPEKMHELCELHLKVAEEYLSSGNTDEKKNALQLLQTAIEKTPNLSQEPSDRKNCILWIRYHLMLAWAYQECGTKEAFTVLMVACSALRRLFASVIADLSPHNWIFKLPDLIDLTSKLEAFEDCRICSREYLSGIYTNVIEQLTYMFTQTFDFRFFREAKKLSLRLPTRIKQEDTRND